MSPPSARPAFCHHTQKKTVWRSTVPPHAATHSFRHYNNTADCWHSHLHQQGAQAHTSASHGLITSQTGHSHRDTAAGSGEADTAPSLRTSRHTTTTTTHITVTTTTQASPLPRTTTVPQHLLVSFSVQDTAEAWGKSRTVTNTGGHSLEVCLAGQHNDIHAPKVT
ncbi:hypothetical protein E2C01_050524 [Portunus trituberculatus]|uniref:Uncharacterized protein n=1 Tax=Portunus trituberculatus TaxID=210409 RepID=A0A5B7G979_PORTR|nr:hypothetical protein [Portunus trituberculatus]